MDEGLQIPQSIQEATDKFCNQSNLIKQFIDEYIEANSDGGESVTSVYERYSHWAKRSGYKPLSTNLFNTAFEATTKAIKERKSAGIVWSGIKLKDNLPLSSLF